MAQLRIQGRGHGTPSDHIGNPLYQRDQTPWNVKKPLPKKYSLISLGFIVLCLETSIKPHIIHIGIIDNKLKLIKRK